ncbi:MULTISPECIES: FAD-dependent oxidoreductase [unclassified Salinibacterium]|uniref:FAD-dependent oxidoreductase n=1 Tax=unclassified Salinibacterium TaxID=2632331 RepID=UPI001421C593|nr:MULTISPECIES: FAD-dependent oxidoreductase [unclassified Salinibacterium]
MTSLWLDRQQTIETDAFIPGARYDTVIVGAGLTGLVTALLLARSGQRVAVLESRTVGAVTTGNTTAKLSLLQGHHLEQLSRQMYPAIVNAYVEANREGQSWLLRYAEEHGIPVERRAAVSYATTPRGLEILEREHEVAQSAGLATRLTRDTTLPFPTTGALTLDDQAQFDPMDVLAALAADLRQHGGVIVEHTLVNGVDPDDLVTVRTPRGAVFGDRVVLATGTPILNRGLYWAKLKPLRSYALAFEGVESPPPDMYLSVDGATRSVRTAHGHLIVGGNGHPVGRHPSPKLLVDDLVHWTREYWPEARVTHRWSAQDYQTPHRVPFAGWMPRGKGRIFIATGYDKWGMTNAVQASLTIAADMLGGNQPWANTLHRRVTTPMAFAAGLGANAAVAWWYARSWGAALVTALPDAAPAEGQGLVARSGLMPTAVSTVDGETCRLSGVCPHLGAVLGWNDAELSWDCPAHGSRFSASGARLEGPTKRDMFEAPKSARQQKPAGTSAPTRTTTSIPVSD